MDTWAPLWSSIVDSSLWVEPDYVIKVFLTMLALKDSDHVYRGTAFRLGKRANKTETEVLDALRVLSSPDSRRQESQEFEGRRIKCVDDGWLILNGEKYRSKVRKEMTRIRNQRSQQSFRDRHKTTTNSSRREALAVQADGDGDDATADRMAAGTHHIT